MQCTGVDGTDPVGHSPDLCTLAAGQVSSLYLRSPDSACGAYTLGLLIVHVGPTP